MRFLALAAISQTKRIALYDQRLPFPQLYAHCIWQLASCNPEEQTCTQPCHCVLSQPVANPQSRSIAGNRPTFAQHRPMLTIGTRDGSVPLRELCFFCVKAELSLHSGAYFADIILQKRSKNNNVLFSPKTLFTLKGSCARSRCSLWARVFCL